jgi:uncharacterized membrane protein
VGASRRMGNLLVGSWVRTGVVALLVLVVFVIAAWSGATGRLVDLRYANIPWIHPYPPAGYFINPLNPTSDRGDLVDANEASRVKADLAADGQTEIDAFAHGQPSELSQAATGRALEQARQAIANNDQAGVFELASNNIQSTVVGHLSDPNQSSIDWCVAEHGATTLNFVDKTTGSVRRTESFGFDAKYWLILVNGRYLIADVQVVTRSA